MLIANKDDAFSVGVLLASHDYTWHAHADLEANLTHSGARWAAWRQGGWGKRTGGGLGVRGGLFALYVFGLLKL